MCLSQAESRGKEKGNGDGSAKVFDSDADFREGKREKWGTRVGLSCGGRFAALDGHGLVGWMFKPKEM